MSTSGAETRSHNPTDGSTWPNAVVLQGPWAEAAPRYECGYREIDQVADNCPLATAYGVITAKRGGHGQADGSEELESSDGLKCTRAEVFTHFEAAPNMPACFSLGTNNLVLLATRNTTARVPGNDPQSTV
jgi:hypothetical protein